MASWWWPISWRGRRIDLKDPRTWREVLPESWTGRQVTAETSLQVSTFWACVRLVSQIIGTLPLMLYERKDADGREVAKDHPLYTILHDQPNADQTSVEFWEGTGAALMMWGNRFAEKIENRQGVIGLRPFPDCSHWIGTQQMVTVERRQSDGVLMYRWSDRGRLEELPEDKVFHVRGFGFGGDLGLSPLSYARQSLGIATATEEAVGKTFADGLRAKGFFVMPGALTDDQRKQAQVALVDRYSGRDGKATGILENGVKFESVNLAPKDAELLQQRRFSVEDICRFCGVPPIMIGHASEGQTMWGSGVEQIMLQFLTMGLRPLMVRIEKVISRSLLSPTDRKKFYPEFNVEGLLRADTAARAALYNAFATNGIMTRNEIRAKENLSRMDGGDELTVQSALTPLRLLGQQPAVTTPGQPPGQRRLEVVK